MKGEWKDYKRHAQGTYIFENDFKGHKYVNGQGILTFTDGGKYEGLLCTWEESMRVYSVPAGKMLNSFSN